MGNFINAWEQGMKYIQKIWVLEFLGYIRYSDENKQRGKSKRKRSAHYEKNWRESYSKCSRSAKEKSRSQEQTWMVFKKQKCPHQRGQVENSIAFLQGRFLLSENINNWTYTLDKKVPAVFPGTFEGKEWPIFQVCLDEHEQMLTSLRLSSIKHVK